MSSSIDFPLAAGLDAARWLDAGLKVWQAWRLPSQELAALSQRRLLELLRHARDASAFYRELHAGLPLTDDVSLDAYPVVHKRTLMREFDRVSTDSAVSRQAVEDFVADPGRSGSLFRHRHAVWTSSGTTGSPGWFVHDPAALALYDALELQRFRGVGLARSWLPWLAPFMRPCSLLQPVEGLVAELNDYAPALVATYPTAAEMLADEQAAGRLRLRLRELWTGGECLAPATRARLQSVFGCAVRNAYGASEFLPMTWECPHLALHVNIDWLILEPVDAQYRPVAPGVRSHTVLLTNLANRVQPLIRYDLGDSVTMQPGACACGSQFPVITVEGRCDDTLLIPLARGGVRSVVPLALATVLEEEAHVHDFQVVQTDARALQVRLGGDEAAAAGTVRRALRSYFRAMGFAAVEVDVGAQPPRRDPVSGKLRRVVREVEHLPH
jgi:phenylacetate-coenzyme A ligase PaaK-like adenylate-forming protein